MRYVSTRGAAPAVSFTDAILAGLAPDGGLYVPDSWPQIVQRDRFAAGHFVAAAMEALDALAAPDFGRRAGGPDEGATILAEAYLREDRWPPTVAPLTQFGPGEWLLELFHGPSLSFKDVAMQLIAALYRRALAREDRRLTVLCATSGDTGGAAAEAFKGDERVDVVILLPRGRVSDVQRRFMTTTGADNVHALEIDGDFDACQALVKALLADRDFAARSQLSAVNSINWARLLAQSVYYQVSAAILSAPGPVHYAVPTGNFGDAFSGYVAKRLGAPIGQILVATNANDILARALATGRFERAPASRATVSPAMDIQVPSNFERAVFEALDRDAEHVARLYGDFQAQGGFDIPSKALAWLRDHFLGASVDDAATTDAVRLAWNGGRGPLICPHTAVAVRAASALPTGFPQDAPLVFLATAHPAKFPDSVEAATGVRPALPAACADLFDRPERLTPAPADLHTLKALIAERSRAWR